jgi:hypothetical protein
VLLLLGVALAAPLTSGERLEWTVSWMGIDAGTAWSTLTGAGDAWVVETGARNAPWLDALHPIDDWMRSTWSPVAGSRRYETRFREGRFRQDQDMVLGPPEVRVHRGQQGDEGWRTWDSHYRWVAGSEDPISAVYALRVRPPEVGGSTDVTVFNGKKTLVLRASGSTGPRVDGVATRSVDVRSASDGDYAGSLTLLLSEDADRVPLRASIGTRAGTVTVALTRRVVE